LPEDFEDELTTNLQALHRLQNLKDFDRPRTYRYWSVPSYALAHRLKAPALMKRLRELEKIARRLFPDSVPSSRKPRAPLTEGEKQKIRERYRAGEDGSLLAYEFRITSAYVGQLCVAEKAERAQARAAEGGDTK
jgi:hypothetical protein